MPVLTLLFAAILTPLVTALGKAVGFEKARDLFSIGAFAATLYYVFKLDLLVKASEEGFAVYHLEAYGPPFGVTYFVDSLSVYMAYVYVGVGLMVAVYSLRYMEKDSGLDKYYALLLAMVAGMIGVAFAGDFFNLFIFWETMSLSAYVLVAFRKHRWEPIEASFKYLVMSTFGSLLFLYAMSFLYGITGTLNFEALAQGLQEAGPSTLTMFFLVTMIVCGFGVTASVVPFHTHGFQTLTQLLRLPSAPCCRG
jgi:formate hydrogenlyase subunit 3/multisubunit Na+/H+ antiporter MnhD subunit